jgi:hypothetical protein
MQRSSTWCTGYSAEKYSDNIITANHEEKREKEERGEGMEVGSKRDEITRSKASNSLSLLTKHTQGLLLDDLTIRAVNTMYIGLLG